MLQYYVAFTNLEQFSEMIFERADFAYRAIGNFM